MDKKIHKYSFKYNKAKYIPTDYSIVTKRIINIIKYIAIAIIIILVCLVILSVSLNRVV